MRQGATFEIIVVDLLTVLLVGMVAGLVSRRLSFPIVAGYLLAGCLLGPAGFAALDHEHHEIEALAEVGVFFMLFAIGLEFSPGQIAALGRRLLIGGALQMSLVAAPVAAIMAALGTEPRAAILTGLAVSFSSTVLVFQTLSETGRATSITGRRAIGIVLFQDAALVPLLLAVPILAGTGSGSLLGEILDLTLRSAAFIGGMAVLGFVVPRWLLPLVASDRSTAAVVLFALVVLGGITWAAHRLGLPAVIGAFFAGLVLSENRWTRQIDAVMLPFREAFAAVFFASLGLLLEPTSFANVPLLLGATAAAIAIKLGAAVVALRATDLSWPASLRTGLSLAHVGEFSFVLLLVGLEGGVITPAIYGSTAAIAILTLLTTPILFRLGGFGGSTETESEPEQPAEPDVPGPAIVVGAGPVGRRITSALEIQGYDVCVVDLSPVNLHPFAQQGFRTVVGDASRPHTLATAGARSARLVVVCVPNDDAAIAIVRGLRAHNPTARVLVRCRFQQNAENLQRAGADDVVSEEARVADALVAMLPGD